MNCPNIWCIARDSDHECSQGNFAEECELRIDYEAEFCPTEDEFGPVNLNNIEPDILLPKKNNDMPF